jgi:hypothetical protein
VVKSSDPGKGDDLPSRRRFDVVEGFAYETSGTGHGLSVPTAV